MKSALFKSFASFLSLGPEATAVPKMSPTEAFINSINEYTNDKEKKKKLEEKLASIKNGSYEPDDDDESEWDVNDLSEFSSLSKSVIILSELWDFTSNTNTMLTEIFKSRHKILLTEWISFVTYFLLFWLN